jgi:predicted GH43/DUF377 family glycosyl hydrolase
MTYNVFNSYIVVDENQVRSNLRNILTRKEVDVIESLMLALSDAGIQLPVKETQIALEACAEALGNN